MMTTRISVPLTAEEKEALHKLAEMEFRTSRNQAALIIRNELIQRGLLPPEQAFKTSRIILGRNDYAE